MTKTIVLSQEEFCKVFPLAELPITEARLRLPYYAQGDQLWLNQGGQSWPITLVEQFISPDDHILAVALDNGKLVFTVGTDDRRKAAREWLERNSGKSWGEVEGKTKSKPASVYDMAKAAVEDRASSFPAESVTLIERGRKRVYIARNDGQLFLVYRELDDRNLVKVGRQTRCGFLSYSGGGGWIFHLPEHEYEAWGDSCKNGKPARRKVAQGGFAYPESRNYGKRWR